MTTGATEKIAGKKNPEKDVLKVPVNMMVSYFVMFL